ncbi:MAG: methyltransferase domain-containing protein [SAR324 cluster bacterium]|nr:methyltransferase domain-containing protein [SAR324 cluster bacterium]
MKDLFKDKARDWDAEERPRLLSAAIGLAILQNVRLHDQMRVLDFGAGTGLISSHVAPHVKKIIAVDISAAMLEKLAEKPELQGKVDIVCQDITEKPLKEKFDLIMSAMAMHHVKDTSKLIQRFAEHSNEGALIALADLDKEDGSFHPKDAEGIFHFGFDRNELHTLLAQHGFSQIQFFTAHTVSKDGENFPVFLVTATRS